MKAILNDFGLEITAVVIVKIILIFSLKALFFSDPVDRNLSDREVGLHLLGAGGPGSSVSSPEESCHAHRRDC